MFIIKEIMKSKGITLQDIADKLNITKMAVHSRINGNPSIKNLKDIADILNVEITELFMQENREPIYKKNEKGEEVIIGYLKK